MSLALDMTLDEGTKNSAEQIEAFTKQLFQENEQGEMGLREDVVKDFNRLYENEWIGLPWYAQRYTSDWLITEAFIKELQEGLEKANNIEQAISVVINQLQLWGKQVAADFVGAISMLQAEADNLDGRNDEIISRVRSTERGYAGYIGTLEKEYNIPDVGKDLHPGEGFYIFQPIFQEQPGFVEWLFGAVETALIQRKELIKEAICSLTFDDFVLKTALATSGVIEDTALLCGYVSYLLNLKRFYVRCR